MMKKENKIIISAIGAILFGVIGNAFSSGLKNTQHYLGVVVFSITVFFVFKWLLEKFSETEYFKEIQGQRILNQKVKNDLENYHETKKTFKYFSNERLIETYKQFQEDVTENLERLALEEELVNRGLIESSPMHEKMYILKKKFMQ